MEARRLSVDGSGPSATRVVIKPPRKTDVFDAEDFDAVKFMNQIYPDGAVYSSGGCDIALVHVSH